VKKGGPEDKNHAYFCGMDPRVIQILAICNFWEEIESDQRSDKAESLFFSGRNRNGRKGKRGMIREKTGTKGKEVSVDV
jgi:hypothetical protein